MGYRDDQEALRARLDATEERLRETEAALGEAQRQLAQRRVEPDASARKPRLWRRPRPAVRDGGGLMREHGWAVTCGAVFVLTAFAMFLPTPLAAPILLVISIGAALAVALRLWARARSRRAMEALEEAVRADEAALPARVRIGATEDVRDPAAEVEVDADAPSADARRG